MKTLIARNLYPTSRNRLKHNPCLAVLGPRQCGKSTLAQMIIQEETNAVYLDLERLSDLKKLEDPETFFAINSEKLVCLDEIQRKPELFPVLRSILDQENRNGQILILGSASQDLLRQSSETLAGRISYLELTPFTHSEINPINGVDGLRQLWLRGGFPRSFLAEDEGNSIQWRNDFIQTFLEKDIPQLGFQIPSQTIHRLWMMCAHSQGQILNSSKLGESIGVSHNTIRTYIDLLSQTFVLRVLYPIHVNLKKRLIKSPKVFIRDSGLLHALLDIETMNDLLGHPVYGSSWEGFVIENILTEFPDWKSSFYRTSTGSEIDLILEKGRRKIAIECKASSAPHVRKGFWNTLNDLDIEEAWIIAPIPEMYPISKNVKVAPLHSFIQEFGNRFKK